MRSRARRVPYWNLPWMLLGLVGAAGAQVASVREPGLEKARLTVSLLQTRDGAATKAFLGLGPIDVAPGDHLPGDPLPPIAFALDGGSLRCGASMSFHTAEALLEDYALVWTTRVEVLSISTDQIELRASWHRLVEGKYGRPEEVAGDSGATLSLREGDRVLLDFARSPDPHCQRSLALELSAELAEDPTLGREQLGYELWLVHETPRDTRNEYLRLAATQGQRLSFEFPHVRIPAGPGSHDVATELQVDVSGTLRGRLRPDGSLDVSLDSGRTLWYVSPDGSGEHLRDGGEKLLNLQPDEVVRVELPGPTLNTQRPERYARDLEGHSFALILRTKPLT